MRLGISNIAWDVTEDESVVRLLQRFSVDAIDIAPGKYFSNPREATRDDILKVKQWWAVRGIEITGMQALLFGTNGLNIFGSSKSQTLLLQHLEAICRIGSILEAPRLVFGSPKNRDRSGIGDSEVFDVATSFFRRAGDVAATYGVMICLEPNPSCYAANFMTNTSETAHVVTLVSHSAIRMQFDTGALTINSENPAIVLSMCSELIGHVHVSEPHLLPLGDGNTDHFAMQQALSEHLPYHLVTIEMVATHDEPHLVSIERALSTANQHYRLNSDSIHL